MENNKTKKFIIIIVILSVCLLGSLGTIGYLVYNKQDENPTDKDSNREYDTTITQEIKDIYNKYIYYSEYNTLHHNANINDKSSNEYMVTLAVNSILKKQNKEVPNLNCDMESEGNNDEIWFFIPMDDEKFEKFSEKEVLDEIENLFGVKRTTSIFNHSVETYKLIYSSIQHRNKEVEIFNCTNASVPEHFILSEIESVKKNDEEIIIYDKYFNVLDWSAYNFYNTTDHDYEPQYTCAVDNEYDPQYEECNNKIYFDPEKDNEKAFDYILTEKPELVGRYEHTFKKATNGTYYWVSTKKIN